MPDMCFTYATFSGFIRTAMRTSIERDRGGINYQGKWEAGGCEKEEKGRLIYKNHLTFLSAAAGGCKFPFGSSFSF